MTNLLLSIRKALESAAANEGKKVLDGAVSDWADYKVKVASRKAYLSAIDIVNETAKKEDEGDD